MLRATAAGRLTRGVWVGAGAMTALGLFPQPSSAQTLSGSVVDPTTTASVVDASVSILEADGDVRTQILTDSLGRFAFDVEAGRPFYIEVSRLGYVTTRSMLLQIGEGRPTPLTIELEPEPVALRGFEVEVEREAEQLLGLYGHTPESLGERWISQEEIMAMPQSSGPYDVLIRQSIPGVRLNSQCTGLGSCPADLCVYQVQGRDQLCSLLILNGVPIDGEFAAQNINPTDLAGIAVLDPMDAATFFGTKGGGGAVVMWTRGGR